MLQPTFPDTFNLADYFLFDRLREGLGSKTALLFGAQTYSYQDVAERSLALARFLVESGLHAEDRVAVVLPDSPPFVWSIFATLAAGGVLCMGNPAAPTEDCSYMLGYVKAKVLVTTASVAMDLASAELDLPHLTHVLVVPDIATGENPEQDIELATTIARARTHSLHNAITSSGALSTRLPQTHRDDPCIWLFTSGSTGKPKAAMHTHRDFAFNTEVYAKRTVCYQRDDITVSVPRLFFGYATGTNLWFPFAVGATVGLFVERPTAESIATAIATYKPTIVTNVPTMLGKLLDHDDELRASGKPPLDLSSVRFHLSAGEALPKTLMERFIARFGGEIYDGIGSAEMFHIYCSNRPGDVRAGTLGKVVEGYKLRILPQGASEPGAAGLPPGEIGVLWVKGDSVALGYFEDRERSWRTFHGHWCRTGDLFSIDAEGYLTLAGRADDLLKVGGVFVAPIEVEECLLGHPAVSSVAIIAGFEGELTKPKAIVCLRPEHRASLTPATKQALIDDIKQFALGRLAKHKYPRWVEFVEELPKNDRGKVDRRQLAELANNGKLAIL